MKTGEMIVDDVYRLLVANTTTIMPDDTATTEEQSEEVVVASQSSEPSTIFNITGSVYKGGYRPADSNLEDIVVMYTTSDASRQIQEGVVTVNIYFPDIDPYQNGIYVKDGQRAMELEAAALTWFNTLNTSQDDYRFTLYSAIHTQEERDIRQHFVVIALRFRHLA